MRRILATAAFCMLLFSFAGASEKRCEVTPLFSFDYLKAGDGNVPLSFRIDNRSNVKLENVYARIVLSFPFSPSTLARKELRSDMYKLDDMESYTSKNALFKIDVSESAKYGDYIIQLVISYEDSRDPMYRIEETFPFTIHVTGETLVEAVDMEVGSNGSAMVGEDFSVRFHADNKGDNALEWLKVSFSTDDPAIVLKGSSLQVFEDIRGGSRKDVSYTLSIDNNASPKNYVLRVLLEYKDERNITGQVNIVSGIKVVGAPKLSIGGKTVQPPMPTANEDFTLTIKIDNTGTENAEGVKLVLQTDLEGDHEAYLGKIERDDYANAVFLMKASQAGEHAVGIKMIYQYVGSQETHVREETVALLIRPQSDDNYIPIAAGAVVIVILAVAVRIFRKK